jgi:Sec-independent protein translocase protein TatA
VDNIFGVGGTELLLIIVIATIVLGPRQMVTVARELGKLVRNLRNYSEDFFRVLNLELGDLEANLAPTDVDSSQPEAAQPVQPEQEPGVSEPGTEKSEPDQDKPA